ncbi:protein NBR1 homolog isoform X2 [Phalaenopsis equestris]|uniref:protein NBR1 homolog isoform X2 n=1 Tax=Phalaenopsis equestris TaxID=78828 RepID=UPI0009E42024|nr:protein NBR1 homolog isoform X2 [Phalaenopsis equestris]
MASATSFFSMGDKERGGDEGNIVIKVKYCDTLRRFSVYVHRQLMIIDYDMDKLRTKISSLFNFSDDAVLVLTYTDEDGDVVALDNNDELRDAVLSQRLNPLRINVQLKPYSTDGSYSTYSPLRINVQLKPYSTDGSYSRPNGVRSSDNNSDIRSDSASPYHSRFPGLAVALNSTVEKSLKPVPDPIRGVLTNISRDVIKTASTAPVLSELLSLLSKMQISNISQSSQEHISKPVDKSCGSPSKVADLNTFDEPKVSIDLQNQLPKVPENTPKMPEVGQSCRCLGSINYATVDFDPNMSNEHGKSGLDVEPPIPFDTLGGDATVGIFEPFDEPNPFVASTFMCGNARTERRPSEDTSQLPFGFTSQGDAIGNSDSSCKGITSGKRRGDPTSFSCHSPMLHPYRRSSICHDHPSRTFHKGVICDGCGMHPIMGPRYKSTVKENYDLCSTCFRNMGKETEYTRIDWSAFRFPKLKKDHHKHKHRNRLLSMIEAHNRVMVPRSKLGSCFIRDVTVWDGTVMRPSSQFTKIWRMRNNGAIAWPSGTQLVWVRGHHLGSQNSAELEIPEMGFPVDEELDVAVDFVAPLVLGQYTSYWQMMSPSGHKFGDEVWVVIQVDDKPLVASSSAAPAFLNLNLPPEISYPNDEVMYTDPLDFIAAESEENALLEELLKPVGHDMLKKDGDSFLKPSGASSFIDSPVLHIEVPISSSPVQNPSIDVQESLPQVLNPVNPYMPNSDNTSASSDILASSLIVSSASLIEDPKSSSPVSNSAMDIPDPLPPVSYPLIDIYYPSNPPPNSNPPPSDVLTEQNTVEQSLLRELEEMGFKQIDLNKEILRQNHYDLEQSVEHLCSFDEWDPLLKELQEMGFNNRELNRKLLSKNGGSIKRVVMELITGEKGE